MRRRRPGVTAAPTTAAFATGDGPGVTAAPTTAALATGEGPGPPTAAPTTAALATGDGPGVTAAVTTAARPTREARTGISDSYGLEGLVRLDGGDDCLDGDPAAGLQLAAGMADCRSERGGPEVLVDEDSPDAPRFHVSAEAKDVLFGQRLGQLRLDPAQLAELLDVRQLLDHDRSVVALAEDEQVHHADDAVVVQAQQLGHGLAAEVLLSGREFDDQVVDRSQLIERSLSHVSSPVAGRRERRALGLRDAPPKAGAANPYCIASGTRPHRPNGVMSPTAEQSLRRADTVTRDGTRPRCDGAGRRCLLIGSWSAQSPLHRCAPVLPRARGRDRRHLAGTGPGGGLGRRARTRPADVRPDPVHRRVDDRPRGSA